MQFDSLLDLSGKTCPWIILACKAQLAQMTGGSILQVVCTDEAAERDLSNFLRQTGNELLSSSKPAGKERAQVFFIRKKAHAFHN